MKHKEKKAKKNYFLVKKKRTGQVIRLSERDSNFEKSKIYQFIKNDKPENSRSTNLKQGKHKEKQHS